jgi:uncharacterized membrane protein
VENVPRRDAGEKAAAPDTSARVVSVWIGAVVVWLVGIILLILGASQINTSVVGIGVACIAVACGLSLRVLRDPR